MFIHLEANQIRLHMDVDKCFTNRWEKVEVHMYQFIYLEIFIDKIQYLSCFDKGNCILLIKDGEILKEK